MVLQAISPVGPVVLVHSVNTWKAFFLAITRTLLGKCKAD
jgi:hypothetical protein